MHGNNITGNGIIGLCNYISKTTTLKELSMEWNSIGVAPQGLEMFCGALSKNHSIVSLDLRNNRIPSGSATFLANLIRSNNTLQKLDLRWNELGNDGAKILVPALERNKAIIELELAGNKITEDVINVIDNLLERNKNQNSAKSDNILRESMRQKFVMSLDFPKENISKPDEEPYYGLEKGEKDIIELKARYDAQIIAHERTEHKLEELEKSLEQEREKNAQLRQELLKGIDIEKEQKAKIVEEMGKLKENFMKDELKYTHTIQDLELNVTKLENERLSLIVFF